MDMRRMGESTDRAGAAGIAAFVAIAALAGCGSSNEGREGRAAPTGTTNAASGPTFVPGQDPVMTPAASVPLAASPGAPIRIETEESSATPPDVEILLEDTNVTPGETVEIVVRATPDANRVVLSDGLDDPQALVRDAGANTWRVNYRVPLRPQHERWGLSVTAKNEANRWRRVWIFLQVPEETPEESVKPDSVSGTAQ